MLILNGSNETTQGMGMEDFAVLLVWGFSGDSNVFFPWIWGMEIEVQSPRQPWVFYFETSPPTFFSVVWFPDIDRQQ